MASCEPWLRIFPSTRPGPGRISSPRLPPRRWRNSPTCSTRRPSKSPRSTPPSRTPRRSARRTAWPRGVGELRRARRQARRRGRLRSLHGARHHPRGRQRPGHAGIWACARCPSRRWTRRSALTGMEYGGITPVGLPADWPVLVDRAVAEAPRSWSARVSAARSCGCPGALLAALPNAQVLEELGRPIEPVAPAEPGPDAS